MPSINSKNHTITKTVITAGIETISPARNFLLRTARIEVDILLFIITPQALILQEPTWCMIQDTTPLYPPLVRGELKGGIVHRASFHYFTAFSAASSGISKFA